MCCAQVVYGITASPWAGGSGGAQRTLTLAAGEFITQAYAKWRVDAIDEIWCVRAVTHPIMRPPRLATNWLSIDTRVM